MTVHVMKNVTMVTIMAMIITILIMEIAARRKLPKTRFTVMDTNAINIHIILCF